MQPVVSIILSNLNTDLFFLQERVNTITSQTLFYWECIVVDGFSTNGSWEFLQEIAQKDNRFACFQLPKEGIYKAWNSGIAMAKGKYIYIAPSDDTMLPTLLEKMVAALEKYPDCSIAHCNLTIIDEHGKKSTQKNWDNFVFAKFDNLSNQSHIRKAPHDGIIYCCVGVVYTSITQLLIKKQVFDTVGYFLTDQGATADVEWGMRVSFVFHTLHIPEYLATWRIHDQQATDDTLLGSYMLNEKFAGYINHALTIVEQKKLLTTHLNVKELQYNYLYSALFARLRKSKSLFIKAELLFKFSVSYPLQFIKEIYYRVFGIKRPSNFQLAKKIIRKYELENNIIKL